MSQSETENCKTKDGRAENLSDAVAALKRGEVIVYPTETLYGLGADALNLAAVEKVFQLKGRNPDNPIPVLIADRKMLGVLVDEIPPLAEKLMATFWPGPLTLVLTARKDIPSALLNAAGGIGVRISSEPIATELVRALDRPLTATSANPSGKAPARAVAEAQSYFAGKVTVFVDGGERTSRTGSTVVDIGDNTIKIIRAGEISGTELQRAVGESEVIR